MRAVPPEAQRDQDQRQPAEGMGQHACQRDEHRPGNAPEDAAGEADGARDEGCDDQEGGKGFRFALLAGQLAGSRVFSLHRSEDRVDSLQEALIEAPGLEVRQDDLADDPAGKQVGQLPFQPVADLDAYRAVVPGHEEDRAVVVLRRSYLPCLCHPDGKALQVLALQARNGEHDHLGRIRGFESFQLFSDRLLRRGGDHVRVVVHATRQGGDFPGGERGPAARKRAMASRTHRPAVGIRTALSALRGRPCPPRSTPCASSAAAGCSSGSRGSCGWRH